MTKKQHEDLVLADLFAAGHIGRVREHLATMIGLDHDVAARRLDRLAPLLKVTTSTERAVVRHLGEALLRLAPHASSWAAVAAASWAGFTNDDDHDDHDDHDDDGELDRAEADARIEKVLAALEQLPAIGDRLADIAFALFHADEKRVAVSIMRRVIVSPSLSRPAYGNALYFVQHDNNQLGVDREQHFFFLKNCVPHGPKDHAVYFNAACVMAELGDVDGMVVVARLAAAHGSASWKAMRDEPMLVAVVAGDPRWAAAFTVFEATTDEDEEENEDEDEDDEDEESADDDDDDDDDDDF